jgi:transcriptional regulator with XRE-family HTH domain
MNHKDFGKLIAALRKEHHNFRGNQYTQAKLAELTNITEQIVGRIERGEKVVFEPEMLSLMADAFEFSSRDRKEFFLAAAGVNDENTPNPANSNPDIFDKVKNILRQIALPAFVVDSFDNLVLVNQNILSLFDFTQNLRQQASDLKFGFNLLRFVFSTESQFYDLLTENRDTYLLQSIRFFKTISFTYRATNQYQQLLETFTTEKEMNRFVKYFNIENESRKDEDYFYENSLAVIQHPKFGKLKFYSPATTAISSPTGVLYLVSYLPASLATIKVFGDLARDDVEIVQISPWPAPEFSLESGQ